jgi:hypothetical protein
MKKRKRWLLILGTALMAAGVIGWLLWPSSRLGPDSFTRIKLGMKLAEVEEILGPPGDRSTNGGVNESQQKSYPLPKGQPGKSSVWIDDSYVIVVTFDPASNVVNASHRNNPSQSSVIDWLRSQLGI